MNTCGPAERKQTKLSTPRFLENNQHFKKEGNIQSINNIN
jgi:hypothetical protein